MPHDAAACRVFTLESEGARVGIQTHNAGVAGSSPAPAIAQDAQPHEDSGALTLRSPDSATTGATTATENGATDECFLVLVRGADLVDLRIIYGLVDPSEPDRVRYVGQTSRAPIKRFVEHLNSAREPNSRGEWLRSLWERGDAPDMVLLEKVAKKANIDDRELTWIMRLQGQGHADLNQPVPRWFREGKPRPPQPWLDERRAADAARRVPRTVEVL